MNAGGILGSMCFPSFPGFAGRLFATEDQDVLVGVGAGIQRLACRRVVRGVSGPVHPDDDAGDLGCRAVRRRRCAGSPRGACTPSPSARTRPRWAIRASTTRVLESAVESVVRHRYRAQRAHRVLGQAGHHRAGRADGRDDHPAADEHRAGRGGSAVVAAGQGVPGSEDRAVRGRDRVDPLLPGARGSHLRDALDLDRAGLRRQDALGGLPRALPDLFHLRSGRGQAAPRHRYRQHRLGGRLPAQRLDVARCPRGAVGGADRQQRARRRHQQDDLSRTRCAGTPSTRSSTSPANRPPSVHCARPPRGTTCRSRP